jgi:tetratricopeptide (TPR) repeat protein
MQVVRSELEDFGAERLQSVAGSAASYLALLLPELREILPNLPPAPALAGAEARFWLSDTVTRLLKRAALEQPLLLVLDDLQRADPPSLSLLRFLASEMSDAPILCVGAYRDPDPRQDAERGERLAELVRQAAAVCIPLRGLAPPAIGRLVELTTGTPTSQAEIETLLDQTRGNPFFLTQVVPLMRSGDKTAPANPVATPPSSLPWGLVNAIMPQLRRLSDDCQELLALAAVFGRDFEVMALEKASGTKAERLLEILDEAERAGIIIDSPTGLGRWRFAHALVRGVLYEGLRPSERVSLHLRAGESLAEIYAANIEPHAAELLLHFLRSFPLSDALRTVHYAMRAGVWASNRLAYDEAVRYFTVALRIPNSHELLGDSRYCDLLLALEEAQANAGDRKAARETCMAAAELARRLEDPVRLGWAALALFPNQFAFGPDSDGGITSLLEETLEALSDSDDALRVRIMGRLALDFGWEVSSEQRSRLGEEAVAIATRVGDPGTLAYALSARRVSLGGAERTERGLAIASEIVRLADRAGDRSLSLVYRLHRITHRMEQGALTRFDLELAAFAREAEEIRQPQTVSYTLMLKGMRALMEGRLEQAERYRSRLLELASEIEDGIALQGLGAQMIVGAIERGGAADIVPTRNPQHLASFSGVGLRGLGSTRKCAPRV